MTSETETDWTHLADKQILSPREITLREMYVMEYLIDFDYTAAAARIGFGAAYAVEYGQRFRYDPFVQRRIAEAMGAEHEDPGAVTELHKRRVLNSLLKEANYKGPGASHGARVSALSKLAAIHGMEAPTKSTSEVTHKGGQEIKVEAKIAFDYSTLNKDELGMIRKLLEATSDGDESTAT